MEAVLFTKSFFVRWADMDFNGHMRNTAYLDYAADTRMFYFKEHGFSMGDFKRLQLGPVVMKDEIHYFKELYMYETIHVGLALAGLSEDGARFIFRNDFSNDAGKRVATVSSGGCWLDLKNRRICPPPADLLAIIHRLSKSEDYHAMKAQG